VHCQSDRHRELISRPELRQTDRHADEAKADATETAVTGHLCDGAQMATLATFLRPVSAASREQHISDMYSKFALGPRHV